MWSEAQARVATMLRRPAIFGLIVLTVYLAALLPLWVRGDFDSSIFIVAGDHYVTAADTPTKIYVRHHSDGYDGQFYYRFAIDPTNRAEMAAGVRLDHPAWRMQRILYPLVARILAVGRAAAVPAALLGVNLAGLFCIGWIAMRLAERENLPLAVPIAIVLWPGFLLTLTHDTTEILAAVLLLAGVSAWLARRFVAGAAFLALATLTRETSILLVGGLASFAAVRCVRDRNDRAAWREAGCAVAAILAFLAWRHAVGAYWDDSAKAWGVAHNAGWPLVGIGQTVVANLLGHAVGLAHVPRSRAARPMTLLAISVLLWFCWHGVLGAARLLRNDRAAGLAAGWLLILALMSTLTANGPWIELSAFLRAFSECWILGWVLLGMSRAGVREWRWVALPGVPLFVYTWSLCWLQLR